MISTADCVSCVEWICVVERSTHVETETGCSGGGQCCLEIDPFPLTGFLCHGEQKQIVPKNTAISAIASITSHSSFFWHAGCYTRLSEAVVCVVGPDSRINSAGVKGGEGQETRLFPLTWVRGPSGKLLPRNLFRQVPRWKGERPRAFPLSFCAEFGIASHDESAGMRAAIPCGNSRCRFRHGFP